MIILKFSQCIDQNMKLLCDIPKIYSMKIWLNNLNAMTNVHFKVSDIPYLMYI